MTDVQINAPQTSTPADWQQRIDALSLQPLWDSKVSLHTDNGPVDDGNIWAWSDMRSIMEQAGQLTSPEAIQRRVVLMIDPAQHYRAGEATIGTITAGFQLLKPGEKARPHRHSINAIRFIIESSGGAKTIVDGKSVAMERGDLVLTPGWCWHEHIHEGSEPVVWLDVLDVPLHRFLKTETFEPGPAPNLPEQIADTAFQSPNILPAVEAWERNYSPVFRYPWADALRALRAAPPAEDSTRSVRYTNPITGRAALPFLDMMLIEVEPNRSHYVAQTHSDMILCPVRGAGVATIGKTAREWVINDILSVPMGRPLTLTPSSDNGAIFFVITNAPMFEKLALHQ